MLQSLQDAKQYARDRVALIAGEEISDEEKDLIEFELEDRFFGKLVLLVDDSEFQQAQAQTDEELEGFLFHRVPNYLTLLEQTTIEFLSDYLS